MVVLCESYQNADAYAHYIQLSQELGDQDTWPAQLCGQKRIRRRSVTLSPKILSAAIAAYVSGRTLRELAQELGISRERLAQLLKMQGARLRPRGPNSTIQPRDEEGRYLGRSN